MRNPHGDTRHLVVSPRRATACLWLEWLVCGLWALVVTHSPVAAEEPPLSPEETRLLEFFESQVRPLLVNRCFTCHSADTNSHGGLRVDDRQGLLTGGGRGRRLCPVPLSRASCYGR